jgi:hypothetical protein
MSASSNIDGVRFDPQTGHAAAAPDRFGHALAELMKAIASRSVDGICAAYLTLQRVSSEGTGHGAVRRLEEAVGTEAGETVANAFAHRRCYMCEQGVTDCPNCDGSGLQDGQRCLRCNGLGEAPCTFCDGAGWSDMAEVPSGLAPDVRRIRIHMAEKGLIKLVELLRSKEWAGVGRLELVKRRELAGWLIRQRGRMLELARPGNDGSHGRVERFQNAAKRIERLLVTLGGEE